MAISACPKCSKNFFELKEVSPAGGNFKMNFVQCSACGTVVGVTEFYNVGKLVQKQEKTLTAVGGALGELSDLTNRIWRALKK